MKDPRMPVTEKWINRFDGKEVAVLGRPVGSATPNVVGGPPNPPGGPPNPAGGPPVPGIVVVGGLIVVGGINVGGGFAGGLMLQIQM
ncbi:unnamed protein product [Linum tenue]|uniref:Uncharacterized protein n=2 Tax=Linum tenue TaxID=586396 RepID=A0AAV0N0C5_9ROSI|nr:unnamed protein product [Linum tenue]